MEEDIERPWLDIYKIRVDTNWVYLECSDCHDDVLLEHGYSLYDIKFWAYAHLEECGK